MPRAQGRAVRQEALELIVQMLAPIVPHVCHALWRELGHTDALIDHPWPQPDPAALVQDSIEIVVQVNGKLRGQVTVDADANEDRSGPRRWPTPQCRNGWRASRCAVIVKGKLVNVVV